MSKKARIIPFCIVFVLSIISFLIYSGIYEDMNREKTNITVLTNDDTLEIFEGQFKNKGDFHNYYTYESSSNKSSDIVFTTDINSINTDLDYTSKGFSPLVICFRNNKNLNKYLKTNNSKGFLICNNSDKINNNDKDDISCDFIQIINAVTNSKNWSALGGDDKKLTLYCPPRDTVNGELFYRFLLVTLNDGKYPENNLAEITKKADAFYNSPNVIQVNVPSKISKLGDSINEYDIYCIFEADLLQIAESNTNICVTYPLLTVSKHIYLQFNKADIKDSINNAFDSRHLNSGSIDFDLYANWYYRTDYYKDWSAYRKKYNDLDINVINGFNEYELY